MGELYPSINLEYVSGSFAGHLLEAAAVLDKLKEAQVSQELTKNISDRFSTFGPLHSRKCDKLRSKIMSQSLQAAKHSERFNGFKNIPNSEQDLRRLISHLHSSIQELDMSILPALHKFLGAIYLGSEQEDHHAKTQEMGPRIKTVGCESLDMMIDDFMDWNGGSDVSENPAVSEVDSEEDNPEEVDPHTDSTDQVTVPVPGLINPKHNIGGIRSSLLGSVQCLVEKRRQIEELRKENDMSRDAITDISSRIATLEISTISRHKKLKYAQNCIEHLKDSSNAVWTVTADIIEEDILPILDRLKAEVGRDGWGEL